MYLAYLASQDFTQIDTVFGPGYVPEQYPPPEMREPLARSVRGLAHNGFVTVGEETYPCDVANMSASGATLYFKLLLELPDRFTLRLRHDGKVTRTCSVTWDEGQQVGVVFDRKAA